MRARCTSVLFVCVLSLLLTQLPTIRAGSFSVVPSTIYGTTVSFSASYPDFRFGESTNISLTISVTFNNASISAVNITAIYVRLYYSNINLTQITHEGYPPSSQDSYAIGGWYSTDEWGSNPPAYAPSPQKIERPSAPITSGSWSLDRLTLTYYSERTEEVQAKLYILIRLCFLDINGQPIWWSPTGNPFQAGYHWSLFTAEGEAPYVTVYSRAQQQSWLLRSDVLALIVGLVGVVLVITALIVMRRKRTKTQAPRDDTHPLAPPPTP
jgi:hypothetical protein